MSRHFKTVCIELGPSLWNYIRSILWQKWTNNPIGNKSNVNCCKYECMFLPGNFKENILLFKRVLNWTFPFLNKIGICSQVLFSIYIA